MSHRVPTGKSILIQRIHCPECGRENYIHKTFNGDHFCAFCSIVIKDNAHEVDKYFEAISKEEVDKS